MNYRVLLSACILFAVFSQYCSNTEFATLSEEELAWLVDDDNNGVGDSLEKYSPGCDLSLDECVEMAMHLKDSVLAVDSLLEFYIPEFSVESGTYEHVVELELTFTEDSLVQGAVIYYTLDGQDPDKNGIPASGVISLNHSVTIKAAVFLEGERVSNIVVQEYIIIIEGFASAPTFSPPGGSYFEEQSVVLATVTENAIIRYTLDGTEPGELSSGYSEAVVVDVNLKIRAKTFAANGSDLEPSQTVAAEYELKLKNPTASLDSGTYTQGQKVTLSGQSGAEIRYTTDGSEPGTGSSLYMDTIDVNSSLTLKARTFREGWTPSAGIVYKYVIEIPGRVNDPVFDPDPGQYSSPQSVTLTSTTDGAQIYYTRDGTDPGTRSELYSGALTIDSSLLIRALAVKEGMVNSGIVSGQYTLQVSKPSATPAGDIYQANQQVILFTTTGGADIYYTVDGSEPDMTSEKYTTSIFVDKSLVLKFQAFKTGWLSSDTSIENYFINVAGTANNPILEPSGGVFTGSVSVSLINGTEDAVIYYTTDGSKPDTTSTEYTGAITLTSNAVIKAIAWHSTLLPSSISNGTFSIKPLPPAVEPPGGEFVGPVWVKTVTVAPDTLVRYTIDGSTPLETSEVFPESLLISSNVTLKTIITSDGKIPSDVTSESYTIELPTVVANPVLNPAGGELSAATQIFMTTATVGATILYTLDGSDPSGAGGAGTIIYDESSPPLVSSATTIKAMAVLAGSDPSDIVTEVYTLADVTPTITITSPNGGESWEVGTEQIITWTSTGSIPTVFITLMVDGAPNALADNIPNTGSFQFTVPATPTQNAQIVIVSNGDISDISDELFNITTPPASSQFNWANYATSTNTVTGSTPTRDEYGNTYVAGVYNGNASFSRSFEVTLEEGGASDLFLAKYNSAGVEIWAKKIGDRFVHDITLDQNFNLFVSGHHNSQTFISGLVPSLGQDDIFVSKYSTSGSLIWVKKAGGPGEDYGYGIATDSHGDVYVTGFVGTNSGELLFEDDVLDGAGNDDIFVAKYLNDGTYAWARIYGGADNEYGYAIDIDASDNIWVTGGFFSTSINFGGDENVINNAGESDIFLLKMNTQGTVLDVISLGGTGYDEGSDISIDGNSNVYLTGSYTGVVNFGSGLSLSGSATSVFLMQITGGQTTSWVKSIASGSELLNPVISVSASGAGMILGSGEGSLQVGNSIALNLAGINSYLASFGPAGLFNWAIALEGADASDLFTGDDEKTVVTGSYSGRTISFGDHDLPKAETTNMFVTEVNSSQDR